MRYFCPFCGNEVPDEFHPAIWTCCGEIGRAEGVEIAEDAPDEFNIKEVAQ